MLLILDQYKTTFSTLMQKVSEAMGLEPLFLRPFELVHDVKLQYRFSDNRTEGTMKYRDISYRFDDISGVYCAIDSFHPELWKHFSISDAQYAAGEYHALWWSILHGLDCPVINPPAGDTLAGMHPSPAQFAFMAQSLELETPAIYYTAPDQSTSTLPKRRTFAVTDLSLFYDTECGQSSTGSPPNIRNDVRMVEIVDGDPVWIALVGDRIFAATMTDKDRTGQFAEDKIPAQVKERLTALHRRLGLKLAEYHFVVTGEQRWVICEMIRQPIHVLLAHGESLMRQVVACAVQKAT